MSNSVKSRFYALLNEYDDRKKTSLALKREDEEVKFFEHCLNCVEPFERDLVKCVIMGKVSMREYARQTGLSRGFVAKERERLSKLFEQFFLIKYGNQ